MWFDPVALSNATPPATLATSATFYADFSDEQAGDSEKSQESQKSQAPRDFEMANSASWDELDWQGYSHERAGVAEFDGGLSRHEAEGQAFECCIAEWMCQHPVTSDPGQCARCGRGGTDRLPLLPYGDATHGHTWLHGECWGAWYAHRRQAAIAALKGMGIHEGRQGA